VNDVPLNVKFGPDVLLKVEFDHFQKVVNHSELQNFLVDNCKHYIEVILNLPSENIVLMIVGVFVD
jgi:hypothetical protein